MQFAGSIHGCIELEALHGVWGCYQSFLLGSKDRVIQTKRSCTVGGRKAVFQPRHPQSFFRALSSFVVRVFMGPAQLRRIADRDAAVFFVTRRSSIWPQMTTKCDAGLKAWLPFEVQGSTRLLCNIPSGEGSKGRTCHFQVRAESDESHCFTCHLELRSSVSSFRFDHAYHLSDSCLLVRSASSSTCVGNRL